MPSPFHILQQSPHDLSPLQESAPEQVGVRRWAPSRYTVRATTEDGRLILWNTYTGKMNLFTTEQKPIVQNILSQRGFEAKPEGIVKYLHDRGFIVQQGTDEYRRIQLGFGQQHYRNDRLELVLLASEDCNLRCQYCYEDFARGTMQPSVRTGVKNLLRSRLPGLRSLSVSWFGGEPLYGLQAIEDLAPFFRETAEKHSLRFSSVITTNGYLLTPEVAEKLLAWGINKYQITIDGPPEHHDHNRPARDGQGTFSTIFDNLKKLRRHPAHYIVNIRVNFDRKNYPHLGVLLDMIEREFREDSRFRLMFRAVGQWGGPNDEQLDVCGLDDTLKLQMDLKDEARKRGLRVDGDIRDVKMGSQVCYAARPFNFIIGASGKVMKCTIDLDKQDRNVVGRLTEDGELQLDQDKLALWTEPAFEHDTKCQKCVVLPACQGTFCPLIRIESNESPCTPLRRTFKSDLRALVDTGTTGRHISVAKTTP